MNTEKPMTETMRRVPVFTWSEIGAIKTEAELFRLVRDPQKLLEFRVKRMEEAVRGRGKRSEVSGQRSVDGGEKKRGAQSLEQGANRVNAELQTEARGDARPTNEPARGDARPTTGTVEKGGTNDL